MTTNLQKNLVTTEEVKSQLKSHLGLPLQQRHSEFYVKDFTSNDLYQGDVLKVKGKLKSKAKSDYILLISNTCDLQPDREEYLLAIPLQELSEPSSVHHKKREKYLPIYDNLTKYQNTSFFFLPPIPAPYGQTGFPGLYGAFSTAASLSSDEVNESFKKNPQSRIYSLKEKGFYILLLKLSVHFLRPDERFPIGA
jgi:hypothetical protein